ncbi:MAG: hypothetical protein AAGC64_08235 [Bacteroidota bacterium]
MNGHRSGASEKHALHPNQISKWKAEFLSKAEMVFKGNSKADTTEKLYKVIGQQKVELDFLKRALQ